MLHHHPMFMVFLKRHRSSQCWDVDGCQLNILAVWVKIGKVKFALVFVKDPCWWWFRGNEMHVGFHWRCWPRLRQKWNLHGSHSDRGAMGCVKKWRNMTQFWLATHNLHTWEAALPTCGTTGSMIVGLLVKCELQHLVCIHARHTLCLLQVLYY